MSERTAVGVFFGGRSVEHEVSVLTAQQAMAALPADRFRSVPIYVAKTGTWYAGDALRELARYRDVDSLLHDVTPVTMRPEPRNAGALVEDSRRRGRFAPAGRVVDHFDVALPLIHGSHGEDGTLQGLFELCDVAYIGSGVAASAVSMDKLLAKHVLRGAGMNVLDDLAFDRATWESRAAEIRASVQQRIGYPAYVKPRTLGSSIGVARVEDAAQLDDAVAAALVYDARCLVEAAQDGSIEVNCSVLGRGQAARASVCEQPVSSGLLTYADKYSSKGGASKDAGGAGMKGAKRIIPAPIPDALAARIRDLAIAAFTAIGAEGVARVDFLVDVNRDGVVVNEVNTVPGSLSFYLWEASGLTFAQLLTELVGLARQRQQDKIKTSFSIDSWLLRGLPAS